THEASTLLLGSGRGIVQSYMPGKLEMIAKHHKGYVVEVADLDHCAPEARSFISALFLHILETGCAQTATGEKISCANLIIIFSINLPGGKDEMVLKGMGFNNMLSQNDIVMDTTKEIKRLFSSAGVGRLGLPIIFMPFSWEEKIQILELALNKSLKTSLINLKINESKAGLISGTGQKVSDLLETIDHSLGARGIYDLAGELVTNLVRENLDQITVNSGKLLIGADKNKLIII
ncbi:MAG: hypothetical protein K8R53_13565, partial [Bacteroidales bacterium]|nr:hypothetical protein [Bacteroidales bacterium]